MQHTLHCTMCQSKRVRMFNPESLCETAYPDEPYVFDSVATTRAKCDDCGHTFGVDGHITWQQPKMEKLTVKYEVTFLLDADTDVDDFRISIESALGCSDNITSKGYSTKIDLVVSES